MKNAKKRKTNKENSKASSKISKRRKSSRKIQAPRQAKNTTKSEQIKVEKTSTEIINAILRKGHKLKDISKSLKVSDKTFREYRKFLLGLHGGKKSNELDRGKILKAAKKYKVDTYKDHEAFKGEIIDKKLIKLPRKISIKTKYIHVLITAQFNYTDGKSKEQVLSQIFYTNEKDIPSLVKQYLEAMLDYPYVISIKLLRFGYRYF